MEKAFDILEKLKDDINVILELDQEKKNQKELLAKLLNFVHQAVGLLALFDKDTIEFANTYLKSQLIHLKKRIALEHDSLIEDKVIYFLFVINQYYKSKWLKVSRQDVADFANCSREHVSRIFLTFEKNGLIKRDGKNIWINPQKITQKYDKRIKMIDA